MTQKKIVRATFQGDEGYRPELDPELESEGIFKEELITDPAYWKARALEDHPESDDAEGDLPTESGQHLEIEDYLIYQICELKRFARRLQDLDSQSPEWPRLLDEIRGYLARNNVPRFLIQTTTQYIIERKVRNESSPFFEHPWNPHTALELDAYPIPHEHWLWDGYIGADGNFVLLGAESKGGKSTFLAALLNAIAEGIEFLGRKTAGIPVLYITNEEKKARIQRRLRRFGAKSPRLHIAAVAGERWDSEFKRNLTSCVKVCGNAKLVVVDTLARLWKIESENDAMNTNIALTDMLEWARQHEVTLMLVHHVRKAYENNGGRSSTRLTLSSVRGSSDIVSPFDDILLYSRVSPDKKDKRRWLDYYGRGDTPAAEEDGIQVEFDGTGFEAISGWVLGEDFVEPPFNGGSPGTQKLILFLAQGKKFSESNGALAKKFDVSKSSVANALEKFEQSGWALLEDESSGLRQMVQGQDPTTFCQAG